VKQLPKQRKLAFFESATAEDDTPAMVEDRHG
jgi:hypothetical protein